METCIENNLSNLPEKCKNLLSDIKDIIEVYPFMKDVISTYLNSWSPNKLLSTNNKNFSCSKSLTKIPLVRTKNKKNKTEMCKTLATKTSPCHVAEQLVPTSPCIDKKLSEMPVVLLKRLSCENFPSDYIEYNGTKRLVNHVTKPPNFSNNSIKNEVSCTTSNDLNIGGDNLDYSGELSSNLSKQPSSQTCNFPEALSTNCIGNDEASEEAAPTEYKVEQLCSDVYESKKEEKRKEHLSRTKDTESDDELDAISLYTNSISGSDAEEDECFKKSNNILDNCDAVGFKHIDEGQVDQQPEVPKKCVDPVVTQNINHGVNSTNNVCDESSQIVLIEKNVETTPKKPISVENNKKPARTSIFHKHYKRWTKRRHSKPEGCFSARINSHLQTQWFNEYCLSTLSTGTKCKKKCCVFFHEIPLLTHIEVENWIAVVSVAKQKKLFYFLEYSLPKVILKIAKSYKCEHAYETFLKVLEICDYAGNKAVDFILNTLSPHHDVTKYFIDLFIETILKCDIYANTWINFIRFAMGNNYIVPINAIIKMLNFCIVSSHETLCLTVFEVFFQPPKYDLIMFPNEVIRKFTDTLLNLNVNSDLSSLMLRLNASSESLQSKSFNHVESCNIEHTAICDLENEIVSSPEDILSPVRLKFFKDMSEHFSSDFCNVDSLLPELVAVNKNSELQKYYHSLFILKEDIKNKNFDNFIEILADLQEVKHYLEIARELYIIWKCVHASNSQPFYDLVTSVNNQSNVVDFLELILTTIGVNVMLEKYFQSAWRDAYGICKVLLDNGLNSASAQVYHKRIISPCNVVLISCEICMAVNDMKNAVNLIKENGLMAASGWSVKTVEGDEIMRTDVCQKLLELLILRHQYNIASWMMCQLWNTQPSCSDPIDLQTYCSPLICGLLSQNMGSESEKLFLLTKKNVKYEDFIIRLLVVDAFCRTKVMFAREVYAAGITLNVYPPIIVWKPVSTVILSFWTAEEIQISLMIFFEKVAEFFKECDDVNEFNIVIYIKKVDVNIGTVPVCINILKTDCNCHTTKQKIEEILCTKLLRPISWTSSTERAIYLNRHSVLLYVKTFFMESL